MAIQKKAQCDHCGLTVQQYYLTAHKCTRKCINMEPPKTLSQLDLHVKNREKIACHQCGVTIGRASLYEHVWTRKCYNKCKSEGLKPFTV